MTTFKRFSLALSFALFMFALTARAQTPSIEVSTDTEAAEFSAQGKNQSVRVEVYAPSGELLFEGDGLDGQGVR